MIGYLSASFFFGVDVSLRLLPLADLFPPLGVKIHVFQYMLSVPLLCVDILLVPYPVSSGSFLISQPTSELGPRVTLWGLLMWLQLQIYQWWHSVYLLPLLAFPLSLISLARIYLCRSLLGCRLSRLPCLAGPTMLRYFLKIFLGCHQNIYQVVRHNSYRWRLQYYSSFNSPRSWPAGVFEMVKFSTFLAPRTLCRTTVCRILLVIRWSENFSSVQGLLFPCNEKIFVSSYMFIPLAGSLLFALDRDFLLDGRWLHRSVLWLVLHRMSGPYLSWEGLLVLCCSALRTRFVFAQQSVSKSHFLARSRSSQSQSSTDWFSRCILDANLCHRTW